MDNEKDNNLVSLPGAGGTEQTILGVLNRNIGDSETESTQQLQIPSSEGVTTDNSANKDNIRPEEDVLHQIPQSENVNEGDNITTCGHILEFESHLIENVDDYPESIKSHSSGVIVEELCPETDEFSTTSSAETESSTRTVLEVQKPSPPDLVLSNQTESDHTAKEKCNEENLDSLNVISERSEEKLLSSECPQILTENQEAALSKGSLADSQSQSLFKEQDTLVEDKEEKITEVEENNNTKIPIETDFDCGSLKSTKLVQDILAQKEADKNSTKPENKVIDSSEATIEDRCDIPVNTNEEVKEESDTVSTKGGIREDLLESEEPNQSEETEPKSHLLTPEISSKSDILTSPLLESDQTLVDPELTDLTENKDNNQSDIASVDQIEKLSADLPKSNSFTVDEKNLAESVSEDKEKSIKSSLRVIISKNEFVEHLKTEEEKISDTQRKELLDSLPQLEETESDTISKEAKKEYYRFLRDSFNIPVDNRPPVPLQTYRWEDLRRAKDQGGYPWTHLYKRPLGPDEEPEIVLLLRKSQEIRQSESPKSLKKVRIHEEVLVKETERYISDLSDNEECDEEDKHSVHSETVSVSASESDGKRSRIDKIKGILKRARPQKSGKQDPDPAEKENKDKSNKAKSVESPKKAKCCHPIMDKLKTMADKQLKKRNIKKVPLKDNERIVLSEEQKILKLKLSPKAERGEIPHFIEKQDSDEIQEIVQLEESPSKAKRRRDQLTKTQEGTSILVPDEIIELPQHTLQVNVSQSNGDSTQPTPEPTVSEIMEEEFKVLPPKKSPRRKKEHIYEDIDDNFDELAAKIDEILEEAVVVALKRSLAAQDQSVVIEMKEKQNNLDEMGSSDQDKTTNHSAPISSIDSASSEEERKHTLSSVAEENEDEQLKIVEDHEKQPFKELELKSALKREPSPSSDKKVTFSHIEDEAEPHREDIILPEEVKVASRWSKISDHVYEPIGEPMEEELKMEISKKESMDTATVSTLKISADKEMEAEATGLNQGEQKRRASDTSITSHERKQLRINETESTNEPTVQEFQKDIEERYFSSIPTTPRSDSRTDNEIHTSQVDSSALEELPLKPENRKKSFMANAHDRSKRVQQNIRSQAGKIGSKLRGMRKQPSGSPKAKSKERKRFKAPEFPKMKMPEIKRPEFTKMEFKKIEFKRPEFTKFSRPDMSKFKIPERFSTIKLRRTRSLKETETVTKTVSTTETPSEVVTSPKKRFEFNFGTYPRILRKKKEKISTQVIARADDVPSTETPPSFESSSLPRNNFKKGPVGSRWTDKFSDVSGGDSESGKYQRYGSEPESLERMERESSLERRMKDDLDRPEPEEEVDFGLRTVEQRQFEDYDEENRAIHEISKIREGEFKQRRPMVHQDSDLVSEESKEVGWSEKDILRNKLLRGADIDADHVLDPENYPSDERLTGSITNTNQETQSTGSSGILRQKGVIEEIDDDEFFLRKRGISQDNIEIRQYISSAIREGLDTPVNALAQLGSSQEYYPDEMDVSNEQVDYGYDVPPPKPRRVKQYINYNPNIEPADVSQDFDVEAKESYDDNISLPQTGSNYFQNLPPSRPLRRTKKQYSQEIQDHEVPADDIPYYDEDEHLFYKKENHNNFDRPQIITSHEPDENINETPPAPPKAPKRRKRQTRESVDKELFENRFSGRSISNSFLPNENQVEEIVVYRTEHEYIIPLAQADTFTTPGPTPPRRSRSRSQNSRFTDDDRTSQGADSLISETHAPMEEKFHIEMKGTDGYAVVRKEPPPRPPAPIRRKRSSNSLNDRNFSTMPHLKKNQSVPERPLRNYSTIGPTRPPRRKSSTSLGDAQKNISSPDVTEYEELDIDDMDRTESPRDLHSGDVINKMKYRPLPPPPRPPRDGRKQKDNFGSKFDNDNGGEKISSENQWNGNYDINKTTEKFIEVEVSTQTDPLPDDFVCEEFEITDDMRIIEPRISKTLEDILKEEQEAELERAKQLADEDSLSRGIQRFREASQRSMSEKSKGSTDRAKTPLSRPTTPSVVVVERRIPTPVPNQVNETMLEASLTVQPVPYRHTYEYLESGEEYQEDQQYKSDTEVSQKEEEERLMADYHCDEGYALSDDQRSLEKESELPPHPPPRKRSSASAERELGTKAALMPSSQIIESTEQSIAPTEGTPSNRLAVADLEVERLSVNALQAGRILVSQLHGSSITAEELECKSGNLVVQNLEFPPGLIDQIVERVRSSERENLQMQTHTTESESKPQSTTTEEPPARPPPPFQPVFPSEYMQYSVPPPSFYQLRNPDEDYTAAPAVRRRRHHRRRDSSSDEELQRERRRSRQNTRSPEPTIGQLGGQLLNACGTSVLRTMNQIIHILRTGDKEGNDKNISTAIVILILMTLGFLLIGITGDKNIHHHHWDYFNPPGNQGRG